MKFSIPKTDKILNDKNVLYVVLVLAILNLLGYLLVQNTEAVVFFLIVGYLTTYFSKNMIIVLIVSMISTSLFTATRKSANVSEGMSGQRQEVKDKVNSKAQEKKQSAQIDNSDEEQDDVEETATASHGKNRVDLAGTLSEAYDNLQKTVGKDGIKGLNAQSGALLENQKQLMDSIETMQPFLETAQSFMDKLDLSKMGGMLSQISGKE